MGRKNKQDPSKSQQSQTTSIKNLEAFQRQNFLYQAATYLGSRGENHLSGFYGRIVKIVGQKTVLRLDPTIKRSMCKLCGTILIPGKTSHIQLSHPKTTKHPLLETLCLSCKIPTPTAQGIQNLDHKLHVNKRVLVMDPGYELFSERNCFGSNLSANEEVKNEVAETVEEPIV